MLYKGEYKQMKITRIANSTNFDSMSSEPYGEPCANNYITLEPVRGMLSQEAFSSRICEERKRTDRSEKPFILMLVDIHRVYETDRARTAQRKIIEIFMSSKRETDACGWYEYGSTIGIIFTEIGGVDMDVAKQAIAAKITRRLSDGVSAEVLDKMSAYFHCYPERHDNDAAKLNLFEKTLYPDIHPGKAVRGKGALAKRLIDIVGSGLALLIFAPLFCVISLLVVATSKGPVLFRQERLGQFGKKFVFLKFRSMYVHSDDSLHREYIKKLITENRPSEEQAGDVNAPVYKIRNDPRITPIGRLLRKTSLDELPQLINVLKGEMSLVGPRPAIPYEVESYDIWHRYRLLQVKPGITGLWQVSGRSSTSFDDMVRLDLKYVQEQSLWLDFKILFITPWVVIKGKGAY